MLENLSNLVGLAGPATRSEAPDVGRLHQAFGPFAADQLEELLTPKNGFYAFEGALHVLPDNGAPPEWGLHGWNDPALWRDDYEGLANSAVFFAEDVFGKQFCIRDGAVATFEPETAEFESMANSLDDWALKVLEDYAFWTGQPVARAWQLEHGALPRGSRLVPTTPFVLGGSYDVSNLRVIDAVKGMKYRASIAMQIKDLPDGATIELKVE